jgi:glycosyltransferase involved in cell wall biosynthesis
VKIALLALHFAEYASRFAIALSAKHEVLLVLRSTNAQAELSDDLRAQLYQTVSVRTLHLPRRLWDPRMLGINLSIIRMLRDFSPDVLHIQEVDYRSTGWTIFSFRRHLPVFLEVHDPIPHSGSISRHHWRWKIAQWFRRNVVSRVVVHGPRMQAELEEADGIAADRIDDIPIGILGRAGIDDDISGCEPGTFLFFGRIESYKGLRYLLDAGDVLHSRGLVFRLIVAGTGSDLEHHRKRIASTAWIQLIDRYISPAEVPDLFRRAMSVVLPYTDATQSAVAAMAFASSRPAIVTDVGGLPDVVINGENGLIVPPRDVQALADAMEKLLADRRLRDTLATGAGRFAREKLSWPRIAEATCEIYRRAMSSQRSSPKRHATRTVAP